MAGMFQLQGTSQQPGPPGPQSAQERATRSVFVGNIPYEATEEQLKEIFIQAGPVVSFRLVYDRETGKPKGYGFCEYQDQETAQSAMRNLNNYDFNGRPLRVGVAAGESNKDDMKAMQQASGGPAIENPYGEEVEPEKAPEAISKAVASLPPEQMFELMKQMKLCIQNNPNEARNMLLQNPQLAYALLQAQIVMKIVDPQVAMAMLHREPSQIPPLLPTGGGQGDQPMQTGPPLGVPGPGPGPGPRGPMPNQQPMGPPQMGQGGPPMEMRGGPPMEIRGGQPMEMRGGPPMEMRGGQPMEMRGGPPMEMRGGPPMEMRGGQPMEMRGGQPMEMRGGQPMEMRGGQPMEMRGGQPMEMRGGQPMEMRGGPPMEMQGPPVEMRGGPPQGNMPPQGMRMMDPRERQEPGPPMGGPGRPMGPGPSEMGPRGPPFQEPMRGPRPEIRDPRTVMGEARNMAPRGVAPQGLRLPGGGMLPSQIPTSIPTSMPSGTAISAQDQEKAALIMQVLQLTDQQIAMLPPEQRQSILILKDQIAKSAQP